MNVDELITALRDARGYDPEGQLMIEVDGELFYLGEGVGVRQIGSKSYAILEISDDQVDVEELSQEEVAEGVDTDGGVGLKAPGDEADTPPAMEGVPFSGTISGTMGQPPEEQQEQKEGEGANPPQYQS